MIYIFLLIFFIIYSIWTIFIFKKKDLIYIYFWIFLSVISIILTGILLLAIGFSNEYKYIKKEKEKYLEIIDSSKTKIYVNGIYDTDNDIKVFLKNFTKQTRFGGNTGGKENIKIKIMDEKGKYVEIIFYLEIVDNFCALSLKKNENEYIYLGTKENYCDTLAEKYLDKK